MINKNKILSSLLLILLLLSALLSFASCSDTTVPPEEPTVKFTFDEIPAYSGEAYVVINDNNPLFEEEEIKVSDLESYAELDQLGRCGVAYACIGKETMPTEVRDDIGSVMPSGWQYNNLSNNNKYDFVSGGFVYNRCHLIGFQLAGENANEKNLITGTRYLNIEGMLEFEDMIADYVKATGNHVLYRVTPIFENTNLLASGVLLEAVSIEDGGEGIKFCVYSFNVQPGVTINYFTGQNVKSGEELPPVVDTTESEIYTYIINIKSKTVHLATCKMGQSILEANRQNFDGTEEILLEEYKGYKACKTCLPELVIPSDDDSSTGEGTQTPPASGDTVTPGEGDGAEAAEITYIINTNSNRYHLPTCKSAPTSSSRVEFTGTLEELLEQYPNCTPCGNCKP